MSAHAGPVAVLAHSLPKSRATALERVLWIKLGGRRGHQPGFTGGLKRDQPFGGLLAICEVVRKRGRERPEGSLDEILGSWYKVVAYLSRTGALLNAHE